MGKAGRGFWLFFFLFGGTLAGCTPPPPRHPDNICSIFTERRAWYRAAIKAEQKWRVPIPVTMAIIYQESGFRGQVGTRRNWILGLIPAGHITTAYGYAQAENAVWREYLETEGLWKRRHRFSDSFDFVDWYITRASQKLSLSKADAYHQYLAYHEGIAGYKRRSFEHKPEIQNVALLVQERAGQYANQYRECAGPLRHRSFIRWIFESLLSHLAG